MRPVTAIHWQFSRFAVVGVVSNLLLYGGYLLLTWSGLEYKVAMSLVYAVGVMQTFLFNRRWTFASRAAALPSLVKYVAVYLLGYTVNLTGLIILVDLLGYPHQAVQAFFILLIAVLVFLLQRYWVFRAHPTTL